MKLILPSLALLCAPFFLGFTASLPVQKQRASPADTARFVKGDLKIEIAYSRPYKKGRVIFGGLVPYDQVWRTGANEPATFETNQDLTVGGKKLPAGKYTLWTIPHEKNWEVIFNGKMYRWGIGDDGKASREPDADVASVTVPTQVLPKNMEQFTIRVLDGKVPTMVMGWDLTQVSVPLAQ
jgi:hypothetical protein